MTPNISKIASHQFLKVRFGSSAPWLMSLSRHFSFNSLNEIFFERLIVSITQTYLLIRPCPLSLFIALCFFHKHTEKLRQIMAEVCKITRIHKKNSAQPRRAFCLHLKCSLLVVLHTPEPVVSREDAGEYRSRNGVPDTRDGARNDCERICGYEEVGSQICGKAGVLHSHLY